MRRALVCAVVMLTLVSCKRGPSDIELVTRSAAATAAARSSRISFAVDVQPASGPAQHVAGEGAVDFVSHTARLQLDMAALAGGAVQGTAEILMVDDFVYVKLPAGVGPGGTKPWLRVAAGGQGSGGFAVLGATDPTGALAALGGAGTVTKLAGEEIRGEDTDHFRATVDLRKAAAQAGARKADVDRLAAAIEQPEIPIDVWIDDEGRARRMQLTLSPSGTKTKVTLEFFEFGVKVDAQPPAPSEITDFTPPAGAPPAG